MLFFAAIRRQLLLETDFWSHEYDVWASLVVSFALVGTKEVIDLKPRHVRIPLLGSMAVLPVVALLWVLIHGLGADVALLVIGLHSVMFTYMGRGDRESPYHLVAVAGFVAFVVLTFWAKLELRTVQAYVVPVGLGVLVLLHLFQERILPEVRQRIRLVTMLSMLGSAAYYALLDERFPLAFHLTLIVVCLASMAVGSFFRVTMYLSLGFAGLLVDLASILYRVLVAMERSSRMTVVGGVVLGVGVALMFGAAYYKTRQEELGASVEGWRRRFASWE